MVLRQGVRHYGLGVRVLALRGEELVDCVFWFRISRRSVLALFVVDSGCFLPWITRSSGRLSRNRLRVLFPQSPPLTLPTLEKSHAKRFVWKCEDMSISMAASGIGVGDCASGVGAVPKLEAERGDSSVDRLRLRPMAGLIELC